jgi:uncharacterized LabA/DUF88 family protein
VDAPGNAAPERRKVREGDQERRKGSDVNLATHLVSDAYEDAFDTAVLVTNDSDLKEPVDLIRRKLGKPIGVLNPHKQAAIALTRVASFTKTIRAGALQASQFPDQLTDGRGSFNKPVGW